ncbi:hypothetical protein [Serratia nematodiphila]|uniref:hypothetical protein n=1 Tax=Serratia nematodiphila TaxID=458197 RepID=UPI0011D4C756|nr:hypothetical protein [Serratia nematodiphila]TXE60101.1 hypothetical protein FOT58_17655 [Serratia nematodiphila]
MENHINRCENIPVPILSHHQLPFLPTLSDLLVIAGHNLAIDSNGPGAACVFADVTVKTFKQVF